MVYYFIKLFVSAGTILAVSEIAKRNNYVASIIHSLPLTSLLAFTWIYLEVSRKDGAEKAGNLIANHAFGTFWFVLPTLPMFLVLPWMIRRGWGFWPSFAACIAGTFVLYLLTMRILAWLKVQI